MANKYNIPEKDLEEIRARDKKCVYCHKEMLKPNVGVPRRDWATIEHMNYLPPWNNSSTVAICCWSCNSSRGKSKLRDWFEKSYCKNRINKINEKTVTEVVKKYITDVGDC